MNESLVRSRGELLSIALRGSWRVLPADSDSLPLTQLDAIAPALCGSGAAALAWWRLRESAKAGTETTELLREAFRFQTLHARIYQTKLRKIFRLLREAGVEPILMKGWAIARLYPRIGLRPSGDIDLFVRPRDHRAALSIVKSDEARDCWVDLHARIFELADRPPEDLFARSTLVPCDDEQIRVFSREDQLALMAVHLLKHGAWRPLWLCDIALWLESLPADFDWRLCLGKSRRRANWIVSAAGLAAELVGARIDDEEMAARAQKIPAWLPPAVLKQWDSPFAPAHEYFPLMAGYLNRPAAFARQVGRRWPDPIVATVNVGGQFNQFPRIPYQMAEMAARTVKFFWRLGRATPA